MSSLQDQFEQLLADYQKTRTQFREVQDRMAEVSLTATAPRNVVSVTVDVHGQVTGVAFPVKAYRNMTPAELGSAVSDTVREAQTMARQELLKLTRSMMPEGMSMPEPGPRGFDADRLFPENPEDGGLFRAFTDE